MSAAEHQRRHLGGFAAAVALFAVVWAVWMESFSLSVLLQGVVLSLLALLITNRHLLKTPYQYVFRLHPLTALRYVAVLFVEIFRSGVHAMYVTLSGRIDIGVVDLPSRITDPFRGALVANAITLTPGTVTIDHRPGTFKVVWIECRTTDPYEAAEMIKGKFERVLLGRVDRSEDGEGGGAV